MAGIPLKTPRWKRISKQPWLYEIINAVLGMGAGLIAAYKFFDDKQPGRGWISIGVVVLIGLATVVKATLQWLAEEKQYSTHELGGCLETLRSILTGDDEEAAPDPDLRLTLHVPVPGTNELEQVIDYIGGKGHQGTAGRRFPAASGVIGLAFREREAKVWERQNDHYEDYVQELVQQWSFTEESARSIDKSRMAGMAIPLVDGANNVAGILYMDALVRGFFSEERQKIAASGTLGIAGYIARRYK